MKNNILKHLSLLGLMLTATTMFAQIPNSNMNFESSVHDFGLIKENGGPAIYTFEFVNKANTPIIINNVTASCGCTTPEWTKAPVAPGQKGTIKVTYDPKNRPGPFEKTITINYNQSPNVAVLRIKGAVQEHEKTLADLYPRQLGDLRLQSSYKAFIRLINTEVKTDSLPMVNAGSNPLTVTFGFIPAHLTIKAVPQTLKPGEKGNIMITYDAAKKNDWGFVTDNFEVLLNGEKVPNNLLTVSANIMEDFSKLTPEQLANAPAIHFDELVFDFGSVVAGTPVEHVYKFTNTGKSDLVIRKVKASCGCTSVAPDISVIKPGQSSVIKATFRSDHYSGHQTKTITVTSNDPKNSNVILRLTGDVMPKQE
ncbi:MAG TPA: DUF1573 domain-containing protein [Williamwhitmania sp.]|nr:DUF1573 domain-containing protein [Williamwhitmania sp.]